MAAPNGNFFVNLRRSIEARYTRAINALLKKIEKDVLSQPTVEAALRALDRITRSSFFTKAAEALARRAVTMIAVGEKKTWREAASASARGRQIYNALMKELGKGQMDQVIADAVEKNSLLIKTVPLDLAKRFSELAKENYLQGKRPDEVMEIIQKEAPHLREFEARRIARTESAKASTELVKARAESMGLDFYVWYSCGDERVRDSHRRMHKIVCRWSDPPNPEELFPGPDGRSYGAYHPGGIFNCRCIALPVVDPVLDIVYPAPFHFHGRIVTVKSFKALQELCQGSIV